MCGVYIIEYAGDLDTVASSDRWLVKDARDGKYIGFSTRQSALKYAYTKLKKKYSDRAERGAMGLLSIYDMNTHSKSQPFSPSYWIGWRDQVPVIRDRHDNILRLYATGNTKLI